MTESRNETTSRAAGPNSRRDFLRDLIGKTGELALGEARRRMELAARRFIRPPGAVSEADFIAGCTRCGDCVSACPAGVIFMLGVHLGLAVGTPALDLVHNACALCPDFPCITACGPGALRQLAGAPPRLATLRIEANACLPFQGPECGVCVSVCPVEGAMGLKGARPSIAPEHCTVCALCLRACIVSPSAITVHSLTEA